MQRDIEMLTSVKNRLEEEKKGHLVELRDVKAKLNNVLVHSKNSALEGLDSEIDEA